MRDFTFSATRAVIPFVLVLAACSESDPTGPGSTNKEPTMTVAASAAWSFVSFGTNPTEVPVASASESAAWDVAFFGTSVMLNGGAAGPGGVVGYCVCGNSKLTDLQVKDLKAESQRASFDAVSASQIPQADSLWQSDVLSPAITGWYRYDMATHQVAGNPAQSFYVRTSDGVSFAKFRVVKIEEATRTSAGKVTFEYALQPTKGAPMGATRSVVVRVPASGRLAYDFNSGTESTSGWDVAFEGFNVRVNGGVSGSAQGGAVAVTTPFAEIADASAPPATVYKSDAFGGVFDAKKWYRYNITGTDHQIWPTYDVFLIKRGTAVYKIQLINYYNAAGEGRHITFRYAKVAG
jgi:hypothetical protein